MGAKRRRIEAGVKAKVALAAAGGSHDERIGVAVRRAFHPDRPMEAATARRGDGTVLRRSTPRSPKPGRLGRRIVRADRPLADGGGLVGKKSCPTRLSSNGSGIEPDHPRLSLRRQCELLGLNRSSWYYDSVGASAENLALMRRIDEQYLKTPCYGRRRMGETLGIDDRRAGRLMRCMGLEAIYPKPHLSQNRKEHRIYRICCGM